MAHREVIQHRRPGIPGLQGIENLSDVEKTARITMIADDVISAITQIADMKNFGVLKDRNTRPMDDMIDTFGSTDGSYRRELEHLIRSRERSLATLSRRHKEKLDGVVRSATLGWSRIRREMEELRKELKVTKRQLADRELQYLAVVARSERRSAQQMDGSGLAGREKGSDTDCKSEKHLVRQHCGQQV